MERLRTAWKMAEGYKTLVFNVVGLLFLGAQCEAGRFYVDPWTQLVVAYVGNLALRCVTRGYVCGLGRT